MVRAVRLLLAAAALVATASAAHVRVKTYTDDYSESDDYSSGGDDYSESDDGFTAAGDHPTFLYQFDPDTAAGVSGVVQVKYLSADSTVARVTAALDFGGVDQTAIQSFDGNCTAPVTAYKWHVHVKWSDEQPNASASFGDCAKAITGNHYDPLLACGPNSEFVGTDDCPADRTKNYACSPANYANDPSVCEKGDLAGKFGDLIVDLDDGDYQDTVFGSWIDDSYPTVGENTPEWNVILHAVCGSATPRIACAVGYQVA